MTRLPVFREWNTPAVVEGVRRAWREDHPLLLLNPAMAGLDSVADWLASALAPDPGLPGGFHALLLTSGTTGEPRLVALDRASVAWNADTVATHLGLPEDGSLLVRLHVPLFHAFGLVLAFLAVERRGGRHALTPRFDPHELVRWLAGESAGKRGRAQPHPPPRPVDHLLLPLVPAMIRSLPAADTLPVEVRRRLAGLQGTSITGGDRVTRSDMEKLDALLPGMAHTIGYGLTEAGPALAHTALSDPRIPREDGLAGRPLPGVELLPPETGVGAGAAAGAGAGATANPGGAFAFASASASASASWGWRFRSPGQAVALLERGDGAWRSIRDAWLPTGDLLAPVPGGDGLLQVVGRASWCFKRKGETVSPVLVEEALARGFQATQGSVHPPALILGAEGDTLVLRVEGRPDPAIETALRSASLGLPSFLRPERMEWVERFPRNALGKVQRAPTPWPFAPPPTR
jgi:acyl-CoA synthetase (AMP-forming)/AMP-acid ligase II